MKKAIIEFFLPLGEINAGSEKRDNYYPFGLKFNSYSREGSLPNTLKLFQHQEHIDDLGLNWDSFKWRNHQPDIGRFFNVDPLADKYVYNSPYAFSENKVVAHVELEGHESAVAGKLSLQLNSQGFSGSVGGQYQDKPDGGQGTGMPNGATVQLEASKNGFTFNARG